MSFLQIASLWFQSRVLRRQDSRWDYQYAVGKWDKLEQENARLEATASLFVRHVPPGRILEIGCGEALLQRRLKPTDYTSWLGVDISEIAIHRAQKFSGHNGRYLLADMETLEPEGRFDAIVFTESIYYSANCAQLLQRYKAFLNSPGVLIVSICQTKRSAAIWADIHSVTTTLERATTSAGSISWDCEVLSPSTRSASAG